MNVSFSFDSTPVQPHLSGGGSDASAEGPYVLGVGHERPSEPHAQSGLGGRGLADLERHVAAVPPLPVALLLLALCSARRGNMRARQGNEGGRHGMLTDVVIIVIVKASVIYYC